MTRIPVAGPWITQREIDYVADATATAWYGEAAKYHERFESAFAAYLGVRFAVALPSCTSAIHLALLALGVGPGDEVVVPDVTWIASAAPVSYVGATPVFADIDPRTWCLAADAFAACITPRTKAVIPVHLYGGVADMDRINAIAARHGIAVIEDAAEAIGSLYQGRQAGSLGDCGVFSFHGSKTLTTGEGGMFVTNQPQLWERVQVLRDHGRKPGDRAFFNSEVACKYKMSSLQAALGLAQLERIDDLVDRKREIFAWYEEAFAGLPGIQLNHEPPGTRNTYWMVTLVGEPQAAWRKDQLMEELTAVGIDSGPFFHPLSSIPAYRACQAAALARQRNVVSYRISPCGVNLPSGFNLNKELVKYVADQCRAILERPAAARVDGAAA